MRTYLIDKSWALLSIVLLVVVTAGLSTTRIELWQGLLFATVVAGFTHYFIGGYYQLQAISKRGNSAETQWFWILSLLAVIAAGGVIWQFGTATFVFLTLFYFIVHGYFNEITLYERTAKCRASRAMVSATMGVFLASLLYGIGHPSWFFDPNLEFALVTPYQLQQYLETYALASIASGIGVILFGVSTLAAGYAVWRKRTLLRVMFFGLVVVGVVASMVFKPLPYVYLLVAILLYHFVIWFLFFLRAFFATGGRPLSTYLLSHVGIIAGAIVAANYFSPSVVFNMNFFLVATTWHITVSFLNESWFKRWVGLG